MPKKDVAKAVELYKEAAKHGYITAQFNLGVLFESGMVGPPPLL